MSVQAHGPEVPRQAPRVRGAELIERIEDAAFIGLLFAGVSLIAVILVLFLVF